MYDCISNYSNNGTVTNDERLIKDCSLPIYRTIKFFVSKDSEPVICEFSNSLDILNLNYSTNTIQNFKKFYRSRMYNERML